MWRVRALVWALVNYGLSAWLSTNERTTMVSDMKNARPRDTLSRRGTIGRYHERS